MSLITKQLKWPRPKLKTIAFQIIGLVLARLGITLIHQGYTKERNKSRF